MRYVKVTDAFGFHLILDAEVVGRLLISFRGMDVQRAGNFSKWPDFNGMLCDARVMEPFRTTCAELIGQNMCKVPIGGFFEDWFHIPYEEPVGWAKAVPKSFVGDSDIEPHPNESRQGSSKVYDAVLRAPKTHLITLELLFKQETRNGWVVLLRDAYPGPYTGNGEASQSGDPLTFFDSRHPGGDSLLPDEI